MLLSAEHGLGGLIRPTGRCGLELPTHGLLDVIMHGGDLCAPNPRGLGFAYARWGHMQSNNQYQAAVSLAW